MTASERKHPSAKVDEELRRATIAVLHERGWSGLTLERVAEVAGRARSTLWRQGLGREPLLGGAVGGVGAGGPRPPLGRRGLGREQLLGALVGELAADFRAAMYPILTAGGTGRE